MPLQSSGAISLSQIQTEFGGSNPISLNEYYSAADGIPSSGTISMNQFYGKSAAPAGPLQWAGTTMWWYEYFPNGTSGRAQYAYAYSEFLKYFISSKGTTIQQSPIHSLFTPETHIHMDDVYLQYMVAFSF